MGRPSPAVLQVFLFKDGEYLGTDMFSERQVIVGRDPTVADLVLESSQVSRKHAILEQDGSTKVLKVPEAFRQRTETELSERNLVPKSIEHEALAQTLTRTRHTTRRIAKLHSLAADARLLVLVETRASFFSQLNGRYKWTVQARLTVADANSFEDLLTDDVDFPAILEFDHEREAEALEKVAPLIGEASR